MTTRVTAYNERGGVISTWNIEHTPDVYDRLLLNAEKVESVAGFAVDGFGMVTVRRDNNQVTLHGLVNGEFAELDYKIVTDRLTATSFARSHDVQTVLQQVVKDSGAVTKQEQRQACLDYLKKNNLRINYTWLDANIASDNEWLFDSTMSTPDTI